ncbi:CdaR family transcriptional regulator [Deinococcus sp. Leaf326]|uniref:PucR family transcriptional regulator n=1 Tax=Deinococcus sp. Leaf326 TaxID=1736338 RepID=UPI0006FFBA8C|nr:helix-turn-helix domain-containing protein [Deinococcus sp. Leaf326]KQR35627.1 hypothetical protein ASF71_15920 [Deinococcus sp. Leaf326]
MVRTSALRRELGLPASRPGDPDPELPTLADALTMAAPLPPARVRRAYLRLLATELRPQFPALNLLLDDLRSVTGRAHPERALVQWLASVTGGRATVHSSWGDVVAQQGTPGPAQAEHPLVYEGRPVGRLTLEAAPEWLALVPLIAEQARLARLQSAAAGAARRRVGERQFEALLAGDLSGAPEGGPCVVAALRLQDPMPRTGSSHERHIQQLDLLCAVGEGHLQGRHLACLTTVRGDKALWLWQGQDPAQEAARLHSGLLSATEALFSLGVSAPQPGYASVRTALGQALQALHEVRTPRGLLTFERLDPFQTLLESAALQTLSTQVLGRLRAVDDGKLEETLREYLRRPGSLAALAEALNIHVNTLRHRLHRTEEVLGGHLSDPAFIARLYLALQAREDTVGNE